jgi:hypothetical protein
MHDHFKKYAFKNKEMWTKKCNKCIEINLIINRIFLCLYFKYRYQENYEFYIRMEAIG